MGSAPQRGSLLWKVRVANLEVAEQLLSALTKHNLFTGAGKQVYVDSWLTPSQQQQRVRQRPNLDRLRTQGIRWRWSPRQPTQLEKRAGKGPNGHWLWEPAYPPPPN
jgi:hypothetical protein